VKVTCPAVVGCSKVTSCRCAGQIGVRVRTSACMGRRKVTFDGYTPAIGPFNLRDTEDGADRRFGGVMAIWLPSGCLTFLTRRVRDVRRKSGLAPCFHRLTGAESWISRAKSPYSAKRRARAEGKNPASDISPCAREVQIDFAAALFCWRCPAAPATAKTSDDTQITYASPLQTKLHKPRHAPVEPACGVRQSAPAS
jgi:hypothetical protein